MLSDRRNYPKVALGGEASLEISGIVRSGTLTKLSPAGVQIECRRQLVERLSEFKQDSGLFPDFDLEFVLPNAAGGNSRNGKQITAKAANGAEAVRPSCNVTFCRRLSQERYQLDLSFVSLSPSDEARVDAYIDERAN